MGKNIVVRLQGLIGGLKGNDYHFILRERRISVVHYLITIIHLGITSYEQRATSITASIHRICPYYLILIFISLMEQLTLTLVRFFILMDLLMMNDKNYRL